MEVIPVIDLMDGEVVHARRGARGDYRPIRSGLVEGSGPLAVATALMRLAPFKKIYVADLDAIRRRGGHHHAVAALAAAHPGVELWVDRGEVDAESLAEFTEEEHGVAVIGAESFEDARTLHHALKRSNGVLSLDYDANGPIGPAEVYSDPFLWPERVIVMTLARVGAGRGPISSGWRRSSQWRMDRRSMRPEACAMPTISNGSSVSAWPAPWSPARCMTGGSAQRRFWTCFERRREDRRNRQVRSGSWIKSTRLEVQIEGVERPLAVGPLVEAVRESGSLRL